MKQYILKWGGRFASSIVVMLATIPSVFGTFQSQTAGRAWMFAIAAVALIGLLVDVAFQERAEAQLNRIERSSDETLESNRRLIRMLTVKDPQTLRGRAALLSSRILIWISELEATVWSARPVAKPNTVDAIIAEGVTRWHLVQETNEIFSRLFAKDVLKLREDLQQAGVSNAFIDSFSPESNTPDAIRLLAVHLGRAADRLPDEV